MSICTVFFWVFFSGMNFYQVQNTETRPLSSKLNPTPNPNPHPEIASFMHRHSLEGVSSSGRTEVQRAVRIIIIDCFFCTQGVTIPSCGNTFSRIHDSLFSPLIVSNVLGSRDAHEPASPPRHRLRCPRRPKGSGGPRVCSWGSGVEETARFD